MLVVEDDSETRHFLRAELQRAGYGVAAVGMLRDENATLNSGNCHVVILDRMLSDGDGLDFIEELRAPLSWLRNGLAQLRYQALNPQQKTSVDDFLSV